MLSKEISLGLIGLAATINTADISANVGSIMCDTTAVAVAMQERELATALELYHLKNGQYPEVTGVALAAALYEQDVLKESRIQYDVAYSTSRNRQRYELEVG